MGSGEVNCNEAVEQLYGYLDGELTDDRRAEIVHHLDLCGPCADAAGFERDLRALIAARCQDRVPEALKARVAAAIHHEATLEAGTTGVRPAPPTDS
jgi:mycothiol system anti-sigma-R factor